MKKLRYIGIVLLLGFYVVVPSESKDAILADTFAGNEEYWLERCSVPQTTTAKAKECASFKEYYSKQGDVLQKEVNLLNKQIAGITSNISELKAAIDKQESLITKLNKKIKMNEASIRTINSEIKSLQIKITKLQTSIDERNAIIIGRMQDEQATTGTNMSLEIVMGSQDLIDMIRKVDGLNRIDAADQQEINIIKEEKSEQDLQKNEKTRLKDDLEKTKKANEDAKKDAETVKKQKQVIIDKFREQEEALNEKMRSVKVNLSSIQNNMINIDTSVKGSFDFNVSAKLSKPVSGSISAHSFHYPNGSIHMGLDIAVPLRTPIYAPANGIILYANNPVATNSGYIGNRTGYPAGTGNSIQMLTRVGNTTYALSFFHMAQENFAVRGGQRVNKGQLLGLSGNTGNTTGPHCHLEVFNLGNMSIATAISRFQRSADFAWGNGWYATGLTNICDVRNPICREHPEDVYGYR